MIILPTRQAVHIERKLRRDYDSEFDFMYLGTNTDDKIEFPDREIYTSINDIEKIDGEDVVVLHCGAPRPNSSTIRLYQTLCSLNNPQYSEGKKKVGDKYVKIFKPLNVKPKSKRIFFLYPAYGMQDWPNKTGSINAAKDILDTCIERYGVEQFFTIDAHFAGEAWTEDYPLVNVTAKRILLEKAVEKGYDDPVVIGPDEGTLRRCGVQGMDKKRINSYSSDMKLPFDFIDKIKKRDVIVLDDVLETGGTLKRCGNLIKKYTDRLGAAITHLRLESGYLTIVSIFDDVFLTNSIDNTHANVNVTDLVADTILTRC